MIRSHPGSVFTSAGECHGAFTTRSELRAVGMGGRGGGRTPVSAGVLRELVKDHGGEELHPDSKSARARAHGVTAERRRTPNSILHLHHVRSRLTGTAKSPRHDPHPLCSGALAQETLVGVPRPCLPLPPKHTLTECTGRKASTRRGRAPRPSSRRTLPQGSPRTPWRTAAGRGGGIGSRMSFIVRRSSAMLRNNGGGGGGGGGGVGVSGAHGNFLA